jgi:hypothetical protein
MKKEENNIDSPTKLNFYKNNPFQFNMQDLTLGDYISNEIPHFVRLSIDGVSNFKLAKDNLNKKYYSVKQFEKAELIKNQQANRLYNQIKILQNLKHNFLVIKNLF